MEIQRKIVCEVYLDYIRAKACLACGKKPVDADHIKARGWRQAKRVDYFALPLCRQHHQERGQLGNEEFERRYKIDLWREVANHIAAFINGTGEKTSS